MPEPVNPWKTLSSRIVHQSPWLTLYEDDVIKPNGGAGKYTYTQSPPFVLVIGHDGERFILVRQYRYPLKREMIEFPGGSIDEGEDGITNVARLAWHDIDRLVSRGEFTDSKTLAALLLFDRYSASP